MDNPTTAFFAACFNTPAGRKVMEYLKQSTLNKITADDLSADDLRRLQGQLQLVQNIFYLIKQGEKNE